MVFLREDENIQAAGKLVLYYWKKWSFLAGAVVVCHLQKEAYFVEEEFLHKKVAKQKWRLYEDYGVLQKIFQKTW